MLVAYGFSKLKWPGRDILFTLCIATMMVPWQVTMVPLFITFRNLDWINSYRPLVVPSLFGVPYFIFMLRQFFMGLQVTNMGRDVSWGLYLSNFTFLRGASHPQELVLVFWQSACIVSGVLAFPAAFMTKLPGMLIGTFVLHLVMRAYWIGLIGLGIIVAIRLREPKPKQEVTIHQQIDIGGVALLLVVVSLLQAIRSLLVSTAAVSL